jgi:hypothetical protein
MAVLDPIDCGSFTLTEELVSERIVVTEFVDKTGQPVRSQATINFVGELTRSDTGQTYIDRVAGVDIAGDFEAGTFTTNGRKIILRAIDGGSIPLTVGRQIFESGQLVFSAGQNEVDILDPGAGLCAALA